MTNPYHGYEYKMHVEDYLPTEEMIKPADPGALKGLMEVYRDTANQLNAEKLHTQKAHSDFIDAQDRYARAMSEKAELEKKLEKAEENFEGIKHLRKEAIDHLEAELKKEKDHAEKLRRHRDELAEKVGKARAIRTDLNDFLETFDEGEDTLSLINILRDVADRLEIDLGEGNE